MEGVWVAGTGRNGVGAERRKGVRVQGPSTRYPKSETRNPRAETRNPKSKSRNPKAKNREPKPECRHGDEMAAQREAAAATEARAIKEADALRAQVSWPSPRECISQLDGQNLVDSAATTPGLRPRAVARSARESEGGSHAKMLEGPI